QGTAARGVTVIVSQWGETLPKELHSIGDEGTRESLPRWATTDAEGRYRIRVGPGRFELLVLEGNPRRREVTVETEKEIIIDFRVDGSAQRRPLAGVAIEITPAGERPVDGAIIEASPVGRAGFENRAVADREGRFRLSANPGHDLVLYVHDRAGTIAG